MVRNYKSKLNRKPTSPSKICAAINLLKAGWSLRKAAANKGLNRQTLFKAFKKSKNAADMQNVSYKLTYKSRNVFSEELDNAIADYCIQVARMGYGLTVKMARDLAFEVAEKNNLKVPPSWKRNNTAGIDWFHGFQKRHPNISIRVPETCSIARAMAFNQTNVNNFFDKYAEVRERHKSFKDGTRVYNLDETSTSTVQNSRKLISPKGSKQVHQVKGAERGISVTTCVIISALGIVLPPILIFPRKKFVPDLLINCFPGTLGLGNENGYMTKQAFCQVMKHFIACTGSSLENPTLLLLDNVESHFSSETLDLAKANGVVILTFPPHCTHRMQPLDVGFFGPFKAFYDNAIHVFLANNPACPPTIYRVAGFVKEALSRAATPQIIIKSFETTGIVPFNRGVFSESDFVMATVTERPDPSTRTSSEAEAFASPPEQGQAEQVRVCSDAERPESPILGENEQPLLLSPIDIRGLPKGKEKESKRKPRRKGRCMVATDTPEKNEIMQREKDQELRKIQAEERKRKREEKRAAKEKAHGKEQGNKTKAAKKSRTRLITEKKTAPINRALSFESEDSEEADDVHETPVMKPRPFPPLMRSPEEGDYVLVLFTAGKENTYYVGKIIKEQDNEGDLEISYYRKKFNRDSSTSFALPHIPDLKSVHISDVKEILPKPKAYTATKRQKAVIAFDYDFSLLKVC